jgi:hypothetical protein
MSTHEDLTELIASEHLWRIEAPHFVAGLLIDAQHQIRTTAPILRFWQGRYLSHLLRYARENHWRLTQLS